MNGCTKIPLLTDEDFYTVRKQGIGGSDAAAVLGLSPYMTPGELWEEKTSDNIKKLSNDILQFGHDAEAPLIRLFEIQNNLVSEDTKGFTLMKDEYPFIRVNLDGFITSENAVLEIKTVNRNFDGWKVGKIPDNYYVQLLHEMYVSGADKAYIYALLNSPYLDSLKGQIVQYTVEHSQKVNAEIEFLVSKEIEFWKSVEEGKKPLTKVSL